MKTPATFVIDPKEVRRALGQTQAEFWTKIGVTQSGGSRYERDRRMPKSVQELLRIVHMERIDLSRVNRLDFQAIEYFKADQPDVYKRMCEKVGRSLPQDPLARRKNTGRGSKPKGPMMERPSLHKVVGDFDPEMDDADDETLDEATVSGRGPSSDSPLLYEEAQALRTQRRY